MKIPVTNAISHKSWTDHRALCSTIVLVLLPALFLQAQSAQPAQPAQPAIASLPADHHDVYNAFFQYHVSWQKSAVVQAKGKTSSLNQSATDFAKFVHVDTKEIGIVSGVSGNVADRLNVLSVARSAYLASHSDKPSPHDLDQFEIRRQRIILSGVSELSKRLKPSSWNGLHAYVNQDYRLRGSVLPIGAN